MTIPTPTAAPATLGTEYPKQQQRCRELLAQYKEIGPVGMFGYVAISQILRNADKAAISGDIVAMLRAYEAMKGCE